MIYFLAHQTPVQNMDLIKMYFSYETSWYSCLRCLNYLFWLQKQWFCQESGKRLAHLHFLKQFESIRQKAISCVEKRTYFYVWKSGISMVKIDPSRDTSKVYRAYDFHEFVNTSLAMNILNIRLVLLDKLIQC